MSALYFTILRVCLALNKIPMLSWSFKLLAPPPSVDRTQQFKPWPDPGRAGETRVSVGEQQAPYKFPGYLGAGLVGAV